MTLTCRPEPSGAGIVPSLPMCPLRVRGSTGRSWPSRRGKPLGPCLAGRAFCIRRADPKPQAEGTASSRLGPVENMNRPSVLKRTVKVLLPLPLADAYDYSIPDGLDVVAGHFVIVPLGKRETVGVVWGEGSGEVLPEKLRDIAHVLPVLPMADPLRRFVDWVGAYTLAPPGAVLRMAMSVPSALEASKTEIVYRAAAQPDDAALKLTAARRRVLEQLKDGPAMPAAELAHVAGVGTSVIKTMASIGLLEAVERTMRRSFAQPDGKQQGPALSSEQAVA